VEGANNMLWWHNRPWWVCVLIHKPNQLVFNQWRAFVQSFLVNPVRTNLKFVRQFVTFLHQLLWRIDDILHHLFRDQSPPWCYFSLFAQNKARGGRISKGLYRPLSHYRPQGKAICWWSMHEFPCQHERIKTTCRQLHEGGRHEEI